MNKQSREALEAYYREAGTWAHDRQDSLRASRRTAWVIASGAAIIAVLEAIALIVLMPLKTVEPYTLLVDRHTGFVQALQPLDPQRLSGDTALTQSFLVQYVIARESFDIDALQSNYRRVALWSAETARSSYISQVQASNPESPLARYPRSTVIETRVKSVSPVGPNVAMVRFETFRREQNGQLQPPQAWVAMIRYRYTGEPMRLEDRFVNPLGFQVLRYRRDAETLPPDEARPSAVPGQARPGATVPPSATPATPGAAPPAPVAPPPPAEAEIQL
ncbi:MAG TPA: VirB8/TrbF family protein [Allosphingosinicella sp.]|jgi:type IV secretion system protein VirB8